MSMKGKNNSIASWTVYMIVLMCALFLTTSTMAVDAEPGNAALKYYQALLICPDLDSIPVETMRSVFGPVGLHSTEATGSVEQVRPYVKKHNQAIQIAESASMMSRCDWALPYAPYGGESDLSRKVSSRAKVLAFLISADARTLATDGNYKAGFARCLMLRRVAKHFAIWQGNPLARSLEGRALRCTRQILQEMPSDVDTLRWLSAELSAMPSVMAPLATVTKKDFECMFAELPNQLDYPRMRELLVEKASSEKQRNNVINLTDGEVLDLIRQTTAEFLDPALKTLASDIPYVTKYERIKSLVKDFEELRKTDPAVTIVAFAHAERVLDLYDNEVLYKSFESAIKVAAKVYYLRAAGGRLPPALPDGLAKDPYSGQDFKYEITDDGFLLRCRSKDLGDGKIHQFAFKVHDK